MQIMAFEDAKTYRFTPFDTARYGEPAGCDVMNGAERERLVNNVVGRLLNGVSEPVLQPAFDYWRNVDTDFGNRIEKGVRH
jgi:catalase